MSSGLQKQKSFVSPPCAGSVPQAMHTELFADVPTEQVPLFWKAKQQHLFLSFDVDVWTADEFTTME